MLDKILLERERAGERVVEGEEREEREEKEGWVDQWMDAVRDDS